MTGKPPKLKKHCLLFNHQAKSSNSRQSTIFLQHCPHFITIIIISLSTKGPNGICSVELVQLSLQSTMHLPTRNTSAWIITEKKKLSFNDTQMDGILSESHHKSQVTSALFSIAEKCVHLSMHVQYLTL